MKKPQLSKVKQLLHMLSNSVLIDTWKKAAGRKKTLLLTMVLDVLFIVSVIALNKLLSILFPNPQDMLAGAGAKTAIILLLMIAYSLIMALLYSFFKFIVINQVKTFFSKNKVDFYVFGRFFLSNLVVLGVYFALFLSFSALFIMTLRIEALVIVRNFILVLLGFFLYLSLNTAHSLFMQGVQKIGKLVKMTINLVFNRLKIYLGLVVFTVIAFFALAGIYYLFDWAVLNVLGSAILEPAVYWGYAIVNTAVVLVLAFGLLAFNRVYFYNIVVRQGKKGRVE